MNPQQPGYPGQPGPPVYAPPPAPGPIDPAAYMLHRETTTKYGLYGSLIFTTFMLPWFIVDGSWVRRLRLENEINWFFQWFDLSRVEGGAKALAVMSLIIGIGLVVVSRLQIIPKMKAWIGAGCFGLWMIMVMAAGTQATFLPALLILGLILVAYGCQLRVARPQSFIARAALVLGLLFLLIGYLVELDCFNGKSLFETIFDSFDHKGDGQAFWIIGSLLSLFFFFAAVSTLCAFSSAGVEKWLKIVGVAAVWILPATALFWMLGVATDREWKMTPISIVFMSLWGYAMISLASRTAAAMTPDDAGLQQKVSQLFATPAAPPGGYPPQAAPPQAYPPQAAPPQAYPPQAAPPQAAPPQPVAPPPPPAPPAPAAPATPPCATCHQATQYIEQYQRYYCHACKTYV
jgi:hypothetical protein